MEPDIAVSPSGLYEVVWIQPDGSGNPYYYEVMAAGSIYNGRVDQAVPGLSQQGTPKVAINNSGDMVVTWAAFGVAPVANGVDIFARTFYGGVATGGMFMVDQVAGGTQQLPDVAIDDAGDFAIVWDGFGITYNAIKARVFYASGGDSGEFFVSNFDGIANNDGPAVSMDHITGEFVVAWTGSLHMVASDPSDLMDRLYDVSGAALTLPTVIAGSSTDDFIQPAVAMNGSGTFVVTFSDWESHIDAMEFDSSGAVILSLFQVDNGSLPTTIVPAVAINDSGFFTVTWNDQDPSVSAFFNVEDVLYNPSGVVIPQLDPSGGYVNQLTINIISYGPYDSVGYIASVGMDAYGNYYIVWQDPNGDIDGDPIYVAP